MHLKRGTQIIYTPSHVKGDITHPDCEHGFVTSVAVNGAFCRYWRKGENTLRTKMNSELTSFDDLVITDTRPQGLVESNLKEWCE